MQTVQYPCSAYIFFADISITCLSSSQKFSRVSVSKSCLQRLSMSGFLVGKIFPASASSLFFLLKLCGTGIWATKRTVTASLNGSFGAYGAMRASRVCSLFFCCSLLYVTLKPPRTAWRGLAWAVGAVFMMNRIVLFMILFFYQYAYWLFLSNRHSWGIRFFGGGRRYCRMRCRMKFIYRSYRKNHHPRNWIGLFFLPACVLFRF